MTIKNSLYLPIALLFFWLAVSSAIDDSPTMDEQNHIARGIAYLSTGDPRLSMEHPPLVNALSALPLLSLPLDLPTDTPAWERDPILFYWYIFAEELIWERNPTLTDPIYFLARLPIIFLTLLFAALTARLTHYIFRRETIGFVAFSLVLLDPTIMAHGRYSTTDLGGAFFLLIATYTLITRFQKPLRPIHIPLLALTLACAFGSKLSNLGFAPIYALIALLPLHGKANTALKRFSYLALSGLVSIIFLWAIFGFETGPYIFLWERLAFLNQWSGPLPTFLAGIERIAVATGGGRASFLMGNFSPDGFPLYFPIAFLFKTPILTIALAVVGTGLALSPSTRRSQPTPIILLILIIYYFLFVTRSGLNIGYRHLMPILPLVYIIGAGVITKLPKPAPYAIIAIALFVNLTTYPHYLSFFNTIAGGAEGGRNLLIDSNIDWGQDLKRLDSWMAENGVESVNLSYFGSADIERYVTYTPLPSFPHHLDLWFTASFNHRNPAPGIYVISAHNLQEMPHNDPANKTVFAYFRNREPDDTIGGSLLIYRVETP